MSYEMCLEKAGAKVIAFENFGSYQGDWLAYVEYKGEKGFVAGSYGSCSYCDAFESEFGDAYFDEGTEGAIYLEKRYALFGESYLGSILPAEYQLKVSKEQMGDDPEDWVYTEYKEQYDFVKACIEND